MYERELQMLAYAIDPFKVRVNVKPKPSVKNVAVFPCGTEVEITKKKSRSHQYFSLTAPNGQKYETSLRDVKFFVSQDFPGTVFKKRKI